MTHTSRWKLFEKRVQSGEIIIDHKWKIIEKIGEGAFGIVYKVFNLQTEDYAAMKLEPMDVKALDNEIFALKSLKKSPYIPTVHDCGAYEDWNYLVMDLMYASLSSERKKLTTLFEFNTVVQMVYEVVCALETIHDCGWIHRDIKPSNFMLGFPESSKKKIYLIDFGLSRKITDKNGELKPPRVHIGFKGTVKYASLASHYGEELSKKDDLISLYYVMLELLNGELPWNSSQTKDEIMLLKEKHSIDILAQDLPEKLQSFVHHIAELGYYDKPDYDYLKNLLTEVLYENEGSVTHPLPWESSGQIGIKKKDKKRPNKLVAGGEFFADSEDSSLKVSETTSSDEKLISSKASTAILMEQSGSLSPLETPEKGSSKCNCICVLL